MSAARTTAPDAGATGRLWAAGTSLAAPALRLWLRRRAARGKEIPTRLPERWGQDATPRPPGRLLWLHAASVGEAVSLLPVLGHLPPDLAILFTSGTVTSARILADRLPATPGGSRVLHRFVPLDVPAWVARFLDHWRPDAAGFAESEIWPNALLACRARGIPLALINARLSVRSSGTWMWAPGFARTLFGGFAWIGAQSKADAGRLATLAGKPVEHLGNLKDAAPPLPADPAVLEALATRLGDRPRWLAASTHEGDEALAGRVHARLAPDSPGLLTVIVPRHPERGADIAASLGGVARRAAGDPPPDGGVWIADTLGELGLFYRLVPIVLIGKSFARAGSPGGGQNPLEPARLGCAIAAGPAMTNFLDATARLAAAGALATVASEAELAEWVHRMITDPAARQDMGNRARAAALSDAALPAQVAARLTALLPPAP